MSGFKLNDKLGVKYYTIDEFKSTGVVDHLFTTRIGGKSKGEFFSMNLGLNVGDVKEDVLENFQLLSNILDTSIDEMVLSNQVHEANIKIISKTDMGKGLVKERDYQSVDGLITDVKGIPLVTFFADCVPVFFLDPKKQVVGLAHAGWKGTLAKIGSKMIDKFTQKFKSDTNDILVAIGPSIGPCCYNVSSNVVEKFQANFTNTEKFIKLIGYNNYQLNLWEANRKMLKESGIKDENIIVSEICTSCNNDILFSYRKERGNTGRMAAIIKIK